MPEEDGDRVARRRDPARFRVRVPGFVSDEVIGLGDAIQHATSSVGIGPCGGCGRRAEALNRFLAFHRRQRPGPPGPR